MDLWAIVTAAMGRHSRNLGRRRIGFDNPRPQILRAHVRPRSNPRQPALVVRHIEHHVQVFFACVETSDSEAKELRHGVVPSGLI